MYKTFASELESGTESEAARHRSYEDLMATWHSEIQTMQQAVATKEKAKTEAEMMLAESSEAYTDVEGQLGADVKFFDTTKASCLSKTQEWSERKALRGEELAGIASVLSVLTDDSAREVF